MCNGEGRILRLGLLLISFPALVVLLARSLALASSPGDVHVVAHLQELRQQAPGLQAMNHLETEKVL